jgi:hypothetical protein
LLPEVLDDPLYEELDVDTGADAPCTDDAGVVPELPGPIIDINEPGLSLAVTFVGPLVD